MQFFKIPNDLKKIRSLLGLNKTKENKHASSDVVYHLDWKVIPYVPPLFPHLSLEDLQDGMADIEMQETKSKPTCHDELTESESEESGDGTDEESRSEDDDPDSEDERFVVADDHEDTQDEDEEEENIEKQEHIRDLNGEDEAGTKQQKTKRALSV